MLVLPYFENRIEVKIVLLRDNGIAHEKFGVFADSSDNKVAFNGSMNLTAAGLTRNIEAIDCICSWHNEESIERIACYQEDFDNIWNGENKDVHVFDAVEFCKQIVSKYPTDNVDELIRLENEVVMDFEQEESRPSADEPHFPKSLKTVLVLIRLRLMKRGVTVESKVFSLWLQERARP